MSAVAANLTPETASTVLAVPGIARPNQPRRPVKSVTPAKSTIRDSRRMSFVRVPAVPCRLIGRNFMPTVARQAGSLAIMPTPRKAFFG